MELLNLIYLNVLEQFAILVSGSFCPEDKINFVNTILLELDMYKFFKKSEYLEMIKINPYLLTQQCLDNINKELLNFNHIQYNQQNKFNKEFTFIY